MKFLTFLHQGRTRLGLQTTDGVIDLNDFAADLPTDVGAALMAGTDLRALAEKALAGKAPRLTMADLDLAPVVPRPGKIICLGLNYVDHAAESKRERPDYPWFFLRSATSLMAHDAPTLLPNVSERFDWEAELAVVIGKRCKHLTYDNALNAVFGYACFNDISVRDYQRKTPQWTIGKNFDATGGFGPVLVTTDELPAGGRDLRIQCRVNGEIMQDANTSDMIFDVAETLRLITEGLTLEPGDVVVMGTPAGVGQARTPPVFMKAGDVVEVEIEKVGLLRNPVVAEAS